VGNYTLPAADGTSGQVLTTNGSGIISWQSTAVGGNVVGPGTSTNNALALFSGTTGKLIQNSSATLASGVLSLTGLVIGTQTYPASDGTSGQVLSTNGSGTLSWTTTGNVV